VTDAQTTHDGDLKATNTKDTPDRIKPVALEGVSADGGAVTAELPPASWTVLRLTSV
jgi:alpha-N-arabinofuranosidase